MKKFSILSAIALCGLLYNTASAQVRFHVGFNVGPVRVAYTARPVVVEEPVYQEPAQVYDDSDDDDYYYLPDVDAYYDVNAQMYYYNNGYDWISCAYLPGSYRNYNWRTARRYEIREHRPFMRNDFYRSRYNGRQIAEWRNYNRNNNWDRVERHDDRFDNRNNSFERHDYNRGDDHRFDNRYQGWGNNQGRDERRDNRGNGFDRGNRSNGNEGWSGRPSNQNNGSYNRGGDDHFTRNVQTMGMSHRPRT
ncbi:MAG TPA: hypothetical protein VIM55_01810 [Mucilaginibacter sp.]